MTLQEWSWCIFFCSCIVILRAKSPHEPTSPLPARVAIHCVSFSKHGVAEEVSDVPQLLCHGTELIFLGSFTKQVLLHQSPIKISVSVTQLMVLAQTKDWKGLKVQIPGKYWVWRVNYIEHVSRLELRGLFFAWHFSVSCCFHFSSHSGEDTLAVQTMKSQARTSLSQERLSGPYPLPVSQVVCCPFSWCMRQLLCRVSLHLQQDYIHPTCFGLAEQIQFFPLLTMTQHTSCD